MLIGGTNNLIFTTSFYRNVTDQPDFFTRQSSGASPDVASSSLGNSQRLSQLRFIRQSIIQLQSTLDVLQKPIVTTRSFKIGTAAIAGQATSASTLGLTTIPASPTTLQSTAEINTAATSFTPFGPDFNGLGTSSATPTIGGIYLGTNGTGTLTFRSTKNGTHGVDNLNVDVYDPNDTFIESIDIKKSDPINQVYTLTNGLTAQFSAGDLVDEDEFTVDVDAGVPTSYTPTNPVWTGVFSSAEATIGGIYDGSDGSGTYTFQVTQGGIHGTDNLLIDVLKPDQTLLETISILSTDPIDNLYTLSNGLTFRLGAGDLEKDDEFTINVSASVGSAANPDKAFNGVRNDNPNFDSGLSVTAGSFEVNGESISVLATDTINSIAAKITASNAGVTAAYNSGTDQIDLVQKTFGASPTITLDNDTSGFLAATKLSAATPSAGQDEVRDEDQVLSTLAQFSSVTSGNLLINAVSIAIDVGSDSLTNILSNITNSAAGVTASLSGDKVSITSNTSSASVVLDSNSTGLFGALNITEGTYQSTVGNEQVIIRKGAPPSQAGQLRTSVQRFTTEFNKFFNDAKLNGKADSAIVNLRKDLETTIGEAFDQKGSRINSKIGLEFNFKKQSGLIFQSAELNKTDMMKILEKDPDAVTQGLQGLVNRITQVLQNHESALNSNNATTGLLLNVFG